MARINTIFGTAKGSIGNITFREHKEGTGTRAMVASSKVTQPSNPRTYPQMLQRAKFAVAVKFYKRAVQNFFRFAYEDKRSNESDYNAFMRHNIAAAVPMNKYQSESEAYPAIGNPWLLSQGSLQPVDVSFTSTSKVKIALPAGKIPNLNTIGNLSQLFINAGYQIGDIVTLVNVSSTCTAVDLAAKTRDDVATRAAVINNVPRWYIAQIIINPDDETSVTEIKHIGNSNALKGISFEQSVLEVELDETQPMQTFAVIVTRRDGNKLLATSSYLIGNDAYAALLSYARSSAYIDAMYKSWSAGEDSAILKGSVAGEGTSTTAVPVITTVNGSAIPLHEDTLTTGPHTYTLEGRNFDSEAELTENSFNVVGNGVTITSLAVSDATSATLVINCSSADPSASIVYRGSAIIKFGSTEDA